MLGIGYFERELLGYPAERRDTASLAAELLGATSDEAAQRIRELASLITTVPEHFEQSYWNEIDSWLMRSPLERCIGHCEATDSLQSLALLQPEGVEVDELATWLWGKIEGSQKNPRTFPSLVRLSLLWTLRFASRSSAQQYISLLTPSNWIERMELQQLAVLHHLSFDPAPCHLLPSRPQWVPLGPPALTREPVGGALSRLCIDVARKNLEPDRGLFCQNDAWLFYIDIDNLKAINDYYGLPSGDAVLIAIIDLIHENVGDRVFRLGGDELLIVCDVGKGLDTAETIRAKVEGLKVRAKTSVPQLIGATVTIGAVQNQHGVDGLLAAVQAADVAGLQGGNKVVHAGEYLE